MDATSVKKKVDKWREIFGDKFPSAPDEDETTRTSSGGFSKRDEVTTPSGGRFA